MVLGGLHHAGTPEALDIAVSHANNPAYKAEGTWAVVKVAGVVCWEQPARVKSLLEDLLADSPPAGIKKESEDILARMERYKSVIATWEGTKAFTIPDVADGHQVFSKVFPPEDDFESEDIVWQMVLPRFEGGGKVDLEQTYGQIDYACAYLRTTIISPKSQRAKLKMVCDDLIKGWLNGEPVQDGFVKLNEGANRFIVKVGDHGGGWSFTCELFDREDLPLEGLRYER